MIKITSIRLNIILLSLILLLNEALLTSCEDQSIGYEKNVNIYYLQYDASWELGDAAIISISDTEITLQNSIGNATNSIQFVTLYDPTCVEELDNDAVVTTDATNDLTNITDLTFSYVIEVHPDRITTAPPSLVTQNRTEASGTINFCVFVGRRLPASFHEEDITVSSKLTNIQLLFNSTTTFTIGGTIEEAEIGSISGELPKREIDVCFCSENSFDCESSTITVAQNGKFYLCLTPVSETSVISNMQVFVKTPDDSVVYNPVMFGEDEPLDDPLTITTYGEQTDKTYNTTRKEIRMINAFFEQDDSDEVIITGLVHMDFDNRRTSREAEFSSYSLYLNLVMPEIVDSSWNAFTEIFEFLVGLLECFF